MTQVMKDTKYANFVYGNKGIALRLKVYVEEQAKQNGYKGMYTDVYSRNNGSIKLQEKCGYTLIANYPSKKRAMGVNNLIFVKDF